MGNKKRVEIERNYRSTLVILSLGDEEKYLRKIERELENFKNNEGASKTNISNELTDLAYEKILIRTPKKNKVYYKVDWNEICRHFVRHVSKFIKKRYNQDPFLIITKYKKNKYLIDLIKISFKANFELFEKHKRRLKTIGDIFEEIIYELVYHLHPHKELNIKRRFSKNDDMINFIKFSKELYKVLGEYKAEGLEYFYDEYLSKKIIRTPKKNN